MSITSRINEMSSHIEQAYDELQGLGADLTGIDKNIDNIASVLDDIYDSMPQVSGEGTSLTLDNTRVGKIKSTLKGNTSQTGTPTPTTPIPVNVVSGDNEINVCGKNLLNKELVDDSWRNANISTQLSTGIKVTCKEQGGYRWTVIPIPNSNYLLGKTLTVSANIVRSGSNQAQFSVQFYKNKSFVQEIAIKSSTSSSLTLTFNVPSSMPSNATGIALVVYSTASTTANVGDYVEYKDLQLEIGSSVSTYEPYSSDTYPVNLGLNNLFDKNTITSGSYISDTGSIGTNATAFYSDYIEVQPNTTYCIAGRNGGWSNTAFYNSSKTFISRINNDSTFTTTSATYYIRINGSIDDLNTIKITKGSTPQTISDSPIELCKIGNYQDYFYKDGDKWYLHKEIGKVTYNGTEPFGYSDSGVSGIKMISKILNDMATGNYLNGFSNYFKNNMSGKNANTIRLGANDKSFNIYVNESDFASADAWKTWLTTHNTDIYYILATPTNTEITYQPLIDQLNLLEKAMSYDTQTNISQENNDLPFIISASALKEWSDENE